MSIPTAITDVTKLSAFVVLTVPSASNGKLFSISSSLAGSQAFQLRLGASMANINTGAKIMIQSYVSGTWKGVITTSDLTFPKTFCLAVSRNGAAGTIMVNGVAMATTGSLHSDNGALGTTAYVGKGDGAEPLFFTGSIYHLSVYNRSMDTAELTKVSLYLQSLMAKRGVTLA